ncbi:MAG: hypothetical protein ABSE86_18895 [Bryobacteraceae bacterium]|jgi:hypothetical protein
MRKFWLLAVALGAAAFAQEYATDATIEFENPWVRIVRVHYLPLEKTAEHEHPPSPTVYIYVTDGGRLKLTHTGEEPIIRPPVKAGGIRFQKAVYERHVVEELDGIESEYLRIELKTERVDLPEQDVRRPPADNTPYESRMIRILRVHCAAHSACPASAHPEAPAVVVTGGEFRWLAPDSAPVQDDSDAAIEQVRIELKTAPAP